MNVVFADSYYYIAFVNERDGGHEGAMEFSRSFIGRTVTTEWVLTEVADALSGPEQRPLFLELLSQLHYQPGVAIVEANGPPQAVLEALFSLERAFRRERAARNASRTLDLDLVAYGRLVVDAPTDAPGLVLPHPRAHERRFVMGPLAEVAPEWRHPVLGRTAAELAATATVGRDAAPVSSA